jgi:FtsZ-binding cell division protein ZapB
LKNQINEQLNNDLQNAQKQIDSYRIEIETLTNKNTQLHLDLENRVRIFIY